MNNDQVMLKDPQTVIQEVLDLCVRLGMTENRLKDIVRMMHGIDMPRSDQPLIQPTFDWEHEVTLERLECIVPAIYQLKPRWVRLQNSFPKEYCVGWAEHHFDTLIMGFGKTVSLKKAVILASLGADEVRLLDDKTVSVWWD